MASYFLPATVWGRAAFFPITLCSFPSKSFIVRIEKLFLYPSDPVLSHNLELTFFLLFLFLTLFSPSSSTGENGQLVLEDLQRDKHEICQHMRKAA